MVWYFTSKASKAMTTKNKPPLNDMLNVGYTTELAEHQLIGLK